MAYDYLSIYGFIYLERECFSRKEKEVQTERQIGYLCETTSTFGGSQRCSTGRAGTHLYSCQTPLLNGGEVDDLSFQADVS